MKLPTIACTHYVQAAARAKFLEIITTDGVTRHRAGGKLHRLDGPARYCANGCGTWFVRGRMHRHGDLPTMTRVRPCETCDGRIELTTGELNVETGSALYVHRHLQYAWIKNDCLHRDSGPAMITTYGAKQWFKHGEHHRNQKSCIECPMGCCAWAVDGVYYSANDQPCVNLSQDCARCNFTCIIVANGTRNHITVRQAWCDATGQFNRVGGPAIISRAGTQFYLTNGDLHRDDGPAVIYNDGGVEWYRHGVSHRDDGPSLTLPDGRQFWYKNGAAHRDDGPAEIYADGTLVWRNAGKTHRDDGPAVILPDGSHIWYQDGVRHRDYGPALITPRVEKWYQHGQLHRTDGPAITRTNGYMEFYRAGVRSDTMWPSVIYRRDRMIWYKDDKIHRDDGPAVICRAGCRHWYSHGVELFTYVGHYIYVASANAHTL